MSVPTFADVERAIFVDFECLLVGPERRPDPALLGVLFGSDDEQLEQVITDERLAPARVARRERTPVASASDAVGEIVAMAQVDGLRIAGWSFFDRERMIEARPDLAEAITARYVNALQVARPWRMKLHPDVRIEREDAYAARHTLDKYASLAGYPRARALIDATPARWIRHTIGQLEANGGRYRHVTRSTKRDWYRLLEYNRHDLLALRHILLRASRELDAWRAYERTRFCVQDGAREVCFMAGSRNARLESLLRRHGARRWAFITAWNPASRVLSREENERRQAELWRIIQGNRYTTLEGSGAGPDPSREPEESLMVLGIGRGAAVRLAKRFGQLAIVAGERGSPPQLVSTSHA